MPPHPRRLWLTSRITPPPQCQPQGIRQQVSPFRHAVGREGLQHLDHAAIRQQAGQQDGRPEPVIPANAGIQVSMDPRSGRG